MICRTLRENERAALVPRDPFSVGKQTPLLRSAFFTQGDSTVSHTGVEAANSLSSYLAFLQFL